MKKKPIIEDGILLTNKKAFGDNKEHEYNLVCHDGIAIGTKSSDEPEKLPQTIILIYPLWDTVVSDRVKSREVLEYRGLDELSPNEITFGDIMVKYGVIATMEEVRERFMGSSCSCGGHCKTEKETAPDKDFKMELFKAVAPVFMERAGRKEEELAKSGVDVKNATDISGDDIPTFYAKKAVAWTNSFLEVWADRMA
jgi:hypothetical protein